MREGLPEVCCRGSERTISEWSGPRTDGSRSGPLTGRLRPPREEWAGPHVAGSTECLDKNFHPLTSTGGSPWSWSLGILQKQRKSVKGAVDANFFWPFQGQQVDGWIQALQSVGLLAVIGLL